MRLRRFSGATAAEALRRVKATLGPDAVILATRAHPEGGVEITAAVDAEVASAVAAPALPVPDGDLGAVLRELRELGARVRRLDRTLRQAPQPGGLGTEADALAERLALQGLAPALIAPVAATFAEERRQGAPAGAALERCLTRHLLADAPTPARRITAFVGPTGSGKTTTIAKLAAAQVSAGRTGVGLVMADTYRVGAAEQLAAYARLLGVPMRTAGDAGELRAALAAFTDRDTVYVDTAGLGGDPSGRDALARLLDGTPEPVDLTAVVSAGASDEALGALWRQLGGLAPARCVVTKLDEGVGLGTACSWLVETGMALSWLGTGQRVPEDLTAATGSALVRWLVAA